MESPFPEKTPLLISPLFSTPMTFRRTRVFRKSRPKSGRVDVISTYQYSLPIFIPELACMISFDASSLTIRDEFERLRSYDGTGRYCPFLIAKLQNFDPVVRRAVSWGNYDPSLPNVGRHVDLFNRMIAFDMMCTPSLIRREQRFNYLYSPLYHTQIQMEQYSALNFEFGYNRAILFIRRDNLTNCREITFSSELELTIGSGLSLLTAVDCLWIGVGKGGFIRSSPITVHFDMDPEDVGELLGESDDCGYFSATIFSNNNYTKGRSVNLVSSIDDLPYVPEVLLPFLLPWYMDGEQLSDPVLDVVIPKSALHSVIRRFSQFSYQENHLSAFVNRRSSDVNPLVRFEDAPDEDAYHVRFVHPTLLYRLIRLSLPSPAERKEAGNTASSPPEPRVSGALRRYAISILDNHPDLLEYFSDSSRWDFTTTRVLKDGWGITRNIWISNVSNYLEQYRTCVPSFEDSRRY